MAWHARHICAKRRSDRGSWDPEGLWQGLLAAERHSRSLRQRARAPHAYFAAPVRGRSAQGRVVPFGGAQRGPDRRTRTAVQQRRPGRVPRFIGAYHHRQYTVPLCLGVRGPGIAKLRSVACCVGCSVVKPNYLILSLKQTQRFDNSSTPTRCVAARRFPHSTALRSHVARAHPSLHTLGRSPERVQRALLVDRSISTAWRQSASPRRDPARHGGIERACDG